MVVSGPYEKERSLQRCGKPDRYATHHYRADDGGWFFLKIDARDVAYTKRGWLLGKKKLVRPINGAALTLVHRVEDHTYLHSTTNSTDYSRGGWKRLDDW